MKDKLDHTKISKKNV